MTKSSGTRKTISDNFVEEGGTLVLSFLSNTRQADFAGGRTRVAEFEMVFLEVQGFNRVSYRNLDLRDSNGDVVSPLSPESGRPFDRVYDSTGEDVFRVESSENAWQITQASLSVIQDDLSVYPRIPETQTHPGFTWAVGDEPDPTNGDRFGAIAGSEMEYSDPPAALQAVSFESGDNSIIQYGFYNNSSHRQIVPRMNISGRTYRVVPITKAEEQTKALEKALSDDPTAEVLTFGPVTDNYTISLPSEWEDVGAVRQQVGPLSTFGGGN